MSGGTEVPRVRVIVASESSHLRSGYAVMTNRLCKGLSEAHYEVLEFATHGDVNHRPPWHYCVSDDSGQPFQPKNFDALCASFRPDVVISFRDPWMDAFIPGSPASEDFKWIYQPTLDGVPQSAEWLDLYSKADLLLTYTPEGKRILEEANFEVFGVAPPSPDDSLYNNTDCESGRELARSRLGVEEDALIVSMVARNMVRKLYPDLLEAFSLFLSLAPKEISAKTKLFLHTCWPDNGWDIPALLLQYGLSSKVLFAYACTECKNIYLSYWSDARSHCRRCGKYAATFANNTKSLPEQALAELYKMSDCLVQYSCSEGIGIPQLEAAYCGTPVFSVDYSGMKDIPELLYLESQEDYRLKVQRYHTDIWTNRKFALPDNKEFVEKLIRFLSKPKPVRNRISQEVSENAKKNYAPSIFVDSYIQAIQAAYIQPRKTHAPKLIVRPESLDFNVLTSIFLDNPEAHNASNRSWLESAFSYFGLPSHTRTFARMLSDLDWGSTLCASEEYIDTVVSGPAQYHPFPRSKALHMLFHQARRKLAYMNSRPVELKFHSKREVAT